MSSVTGLPVFFTPLRAIISAISQSNPCVITTTIPNGYGNGMQVRIVLPSPKMGMPLINEQLYFLNVIDDINFSIPVNTTYMTPFDPSASAQVAQVIPVGEVASTLQFAVKNGLPAFT